MNFSFLTALGVSLATGFMVWLLAYKFAHRKGYDRGYATGKEEGFLLGQSAGYETGFREGNFKKGEQFSEREQPDRCPVIIGETEYGVLAEELIEL